MKEIKKNVSLFELWLIVNKKSGGSLSWQSFLFNISTFFLRSPSLELRFHSISRERDTDTIYVIKHTDIAEAVNRGRAPRPDDPL